MRRRAFQVLVVASALVAAALAGCAPVAEQAAPTGTPGTSLVNAVGGRAPELADCASVHTILDAMTYAVTSDARSETDAMLRLSQLRGELRSLATGASGPAGDAIRSLDATAAGNTGELARQLREDALRSQIDGLAAACADAGAVWV